MPFYASTRDCRTCPLKARCTRGARRIITRSIYQQERHMGLQSPPVVRPQRSIGRIRAGYHRTEHQEADTVGWTSSVRVVDIGHGRGSPMRCARTGASRTPCTGCSIPHSTKTALETDVIMGRRTLPPCESSHSTSCAPPDQTYPSAESARAPAGPTTSPGQSSAKCDSPGLHEACTTTVIDMAGHFCDPTWSGASCGAGQNGDHRRERRHLPDRRCAR